MNNSKFNEYKCTFKRNGKGIVRDDKNWPVPEKKELTPRGHVMITPMQADHYNRRSAVASGILYILADEAKELKEMNKAELTAYVNEKGYSVDITQTKAAILADIQTIENQ